MLSGSTMQVGSWRINATAFSTAGLAGQSPELGFTYFDATSRLAGSLMVRLFNTGFQWGDQTGYYFSQIDGSVGGGSRLSVKIYVNRPNGFVTERMNDWSPLYRQTFAPHGKNGMILAGIDPANANFDGASSQAAGATGGNVGLLDGSVGWRKIQQMQVYRGSQQWDNDGCWAMW